MVRPTASADSSSLITSQVQGSSLTVYRIGENFGMFRTGGGDSDVASVLRSTRHVSGKVMTLIEEALGELHTDRIDSVVGRK